MKLKKKPEVTLISCEQKNGIGRIAEYMHSILLKNYRPRDRVICDLIHEEKFLNIYKQVKNLVRHRIVITKFKTVGSFRH